MKAIKNRVQLMGYLGADPEIKIFEETKKLAHIRLAVNDRYKNAKKVSSDGCHLGQADEDIVSAKKENRQATPFTLWHFYNDHSLLT